MCFFFACIKVVVTRAKEREQNTDSILAEAQLSPWANSEPQFQMRSLPSPRILMTFIDVFNKFLLSVGY